MKTIPNVSSPGPRPRTVGLSTSTSKILSPLAACCLAVAGLAPGAAAQNNYKLTTLHRFVGGAGDGAVPQGDLVKGTDGRFYGTTSQGGTTNDGTVFAMTPAGELTTLHAFTTQDSNGAIPNASLVEGADGRFYGTTYQAGTTNNGTVFAITPAGALTTLHNFSYGTTNGTDGANPLGGLARGTDGLFYGTTQHGNSFRDGGTHEGFVYSITPAGAVTYLHNFFQSPDGDLNKSEGVNPGMLTLGRDGRFYGVNHNLGGSGQYGTVFAVTTGGALTTLHRFLDSAGEGDNPNDRLVQGQDGRFYGVTTGGGIGGRGTIFAVDAAGGFTVLHRFSADDGTGAPVGGLIQGRDGRLYGTTSGAGDPGTVYAVTPAGELTILYRFTSGQDGNSPRGALFQNGDGSFYGTTQTGGSGFGTVFRLTPTPAFFNGEVALSNGVYYLSFAGSGNPFGYYSYLTDPHYLYHFDLGYEYVFDAQDGQAGVYLYDFKSGSFFYTNPSFPFPYLYDFSLNTTLYYYPDPNNPGRYNTNGVRYFYNFATGKIITK